MRHFYSRSLILELVMTYDYDKPRKTMIYGMMIAKYGAFLSAVAAVVLLLTNKNWLGLAVILVGPIVFGLLGSRVMRRAEQLEKKEAEYHTDPPSTDEESGLNAKATVVCHECGASQPADRETCLACGAELH